MKLNIGAGKFPLMGYKNIDISKDADAEEFYDVTEGIKEKDNSCEEVFAGCILEQIGDNNKFIFVMNELWRVLTSNGQLKGYVPSTDPNSFHVDPMDKRFFTEDTFKYFDHQEHCWQNFGKLYGFKPWEILEVKKNENGIIHFSMKPIK